MGIYEEKNDLPLQQSLRMFRLNHDLLTEEENSLVERLVEIPDWEGVTDTELIQIAEISEKLWKNLETVFKDRKT